MTDFNFTYNTATAIIAILIGCLVVRGYAPSVIAMAHNDRAKLHLVTATVIVFTAMLGRLAQWDFVIPIARNMGASVAFTGYVGNILNGLVWNVLFGLSGLLALQALLETLPNKERGNYSILTVAFYPKRVFAKFTFKGSDE